MTPQSDVAPVSIRPSAGGLEIAASQCRAARDVQLSHQQRGAKWMNGDKRSTSYVGAAPFAYGRPYCIIASPSPRSGPNEPGHVPLSPSSVPPPCGPVRPQRPLKRPASQTSQCIDSRRPHTLCRGPRATHLFGPGSPTYTAHAERFTRTQTELDLSAQSAAVYAPHYGELAQDRLEKAQR